METSERNELPAKIVEQNHSTTSPSDNWLPISVLERLFLLLGHVIVFLPLVVLVEESLVEEHGVLDLNAVSKSRVHRGGLLVVRTPVNVPLWWRALLLHVGDSDAEDLELRGLGIMKLNKVLDLLLQVLPLNFVEGAAWVLDLASNCLLPALLDEILSLFNGFFDILSEVLDDLGPLLGDEVFVFHFVVDTALGTSIASGEELIVLCLSLTKEVSGGKISVILELWHNNGFVPLGHLSFELIALAFREVELVGVCVVEFLIVEPIIVDDNVLR